MLKFDLQNQERFCLLQLQAEGLRKSLIADPESRCVGSLLQVIKQAEQGLKKVDRMPKLLRNHCFKLSRGY